MIAWRTARSVTREVLIDRRYALGVAASSVRSLSAASLATRATSSDGMPPVPIAYASLPLSASARLVWVALSAPNDHTNLSGYWWRTGSVAGSQFSLRSSTISTPGVCLVILYGPDENGRLSRLTPVSLAGGSGALAGSDSANGRSQRGLANSKRSVFASGVVSPGGSDVLLALKSHLVSYCAVSASHSWT